MCYPLHTRVMHPSPSLTTTQQYSTNVLDSHQTSQYNCNQQDYTTLPNHTTPPNDAHNVHWYGSNHQLHTQRTMAENNVILPPDNREEIERKKSTFVVVDSRSRNHTEDPNPNQYTVPLPNEIRDVESIQLVSYTVPKPQFPVRTTNNVLHLTNADPTVTIAPNGTPVIDLHKDTSLQSVVVSEGYYDGTISDHVTTTADVVAYKTELLATLGLTTFKQDMFSSALENALNRDSCTSCIVYIDEHSEQYTVVTNFSNTLVASDDCDLPFFFHPFFEGCEEFYGSTTTERVNVAEAGNPPVYSLKKIGKKQLTYLEKSMGPVVGHPRTDPVLQLQGTCNNTTALDMLTGIDTAFTAQLRKGDWVYIYDHINNIRKRVHINDVVSDTECRIDCDGAGGVAPAGPAFENAFLWVGRLTFPWVRNLQPDPYISMYLSNASTLYSYNQAVDRAFFLVPGLSSFSEISDMLPYKKFSPTLGKLDKLTITFKNADSTLYDFKGRDHVLLFKVVHFRQNIKYGDF